MICLKQKDYSLEGNSFSDEFKYLEVILRKCTGKDCKSQAEIDKVISHLDISLILINAYLDFKDFKDPVKHFVDDIIFYHLEDNRHKRADIFVMKSQVMLEDNLIQVG